MVAGTKLKWLVKRRRRTDHDGDARDETAINPELSTTEKQNYVPILGSFRIVGSKNSDADFPRCAGFLFNYLIATYNHGQGLPSHMHDDAIIELFSHYGASKVRILSGKMVG